MLRDKADAVRRKKKKKGLFKNTARLNSSREAKIKHLKKKKEESKKADRRLWEVQQGHEKCTRPKCRAASAAQPQQHGRSRATIGTHSASIPFWISEQTWDLLFPSRASGTWPVPRDAD